MKNVVFSHRSITIFLKNAPHSNWNTPGWTVVADPKKWVFVTSSSTKRASAPLGKRAVKRITHSQNVPSARVTAGDQLHFRPEGLEREGPEGFKKHVDRASRTASKWNAREQQKAPRLMQNHPSLGCARPIFCSCQGTFKTTPTPTQLVLSPRRLIFKP